VIFLLIPRAELNAYVPAKIRAKCQYTDINWDIVADIVTHHLTDFVQFAQAIDRLNDDALQSQ
jgi:hypothetical protein